MRSVILVEFGAPSNITELTEFLQNLTNHAPNYEELKNALKKYELINGSPLREKVEALSKALAGLDEGLDVSYAFLYNKPLLSDVIDLKLKSGIDEIKVLPLFNFYSRRTAADIDKAIKKYSKFTAVISQAYRADCLAGLWGERLKADIKKLNDFEVIFTAHSIPYDEDSQYLQNVRGFVERVGACAGIADFKIGFQNARRGWLGPSIYDLNLGNSKNVVVVPVSFMLPNMEILYDLDVEYSSYLMHNGHRYVRSGPPEDLNKLAVCLKSLL